MIKARARGMRAAAVVAIGFLIAGMGITAASANSVENPNNPEYWEAQYPNTACVKVDPPGTANSYGSLSEDGRSVVLYANQALLVVNAGSDDVGYGAGNNVFENPVAGGSYQSPDNGGDNVPGVSHWIVCEYDGPNVVTPEFPNPAPPTCDADGALPSTPSTEGIVYEWDGNTLKATAATDYIIPDSVETSRTYELGTASGYQSTDAEGSC